MNLTELDLSENDILFLPPAISRLSHLTSLNLGKNSKWVGGRGGEEEEGGGGRGGGIERRGGEVRGKKEEKKGIASGVSLARTSTPPYPTASYPPHELEHIQSGVSQYTYSAQHMREKLPVEQTLFQYL